MLDIFYNKSLLFFINPLDVNDASDSGVFDHTGLPHLTRLGHDPSSCRFPSAKSWQGLSKTDRSEAPQAKELSSGS